MNKIEAVEYANTYRISGEYKHISHNLSDKYVANIRSMVNTITEYAVGKKLEQPIESVYQLRRVSKAFNDNNRAGRLLKYAVGAANINYDSVIKRLEYIVKNVSEDDLNNGVLISVHTETLTQESMKKMLTEMVKRLFISNTKNIGELSAVSNESTCDSVRNALNNWANFGEFLSLVCAIITVIIKSSTPQDGYIAQLKDDIETDQIELYLGAVLQIASEAIWTAQGEAQWLC